MKKVFFFACRFAVAHYSAAKVTITPQSEGTN